MGSTATSSRARLQSELALTLVYVADTYPSRVLALADEAVAMARRLDSSVTLAEVVQNRAQAIWAPGTVELRHREHRRARGPRSGHP